MAEGPREAMSTVKRLADDIYGRLTSFSAGHTRKTEYVLFQLDYEKHEILLLTTSDASALEITTVRSG